MAKVLLLLILIVIIGEGYFESIKPKMKNQRAKREEDNSNTFDNEADITVELENALTSTTQYLEAFKSSSNTKILKVSFSS